ncbi:MAG: peptidylprolyl isomerase [Hyphomicrobiales bacterium]
MKSFLAMLVLCAATLLTGVHHAQAAQPDPENILFLDLKSGRVVIKLRPDLAPKHVERIKTLARKGFYDGVVFHRVIEGFMAQTGDPTGTGAGGSDLPDLKAEFSGETFRRGTIGMARAQSPDSANSQWFICFESSDFLDRQYTVWGEVLAGMEHVDAIKKGAPRSGTVSNPDSIVKLQVAADAKDTSILKKLQ